jgi:hypothetical protein
LQIRKVRSVSVTALTIFACYVIIGCTGSDRKIFLGESEITTENPVQYMSDAFLLASSRDGAEIATVSMARTITVWDTETRKSLGTTSIDKVHAAPMMFSSGGTIVYVASDHGYFAWRYATGEKIKIASESPNWPAAWNSDRSIAFAQWKSDPGDPVQVTLPSAKTFATRRGDKAGFDQYGNAWFGSRTRWFKVDKSGLKTSSRTHPHFLDPDQSKDRGSMRLESTSSTMRHEGATANLNCIWLVDDRAQSQSAMKIGNVMRESKPIKAALLFAGADIFQFGFIPGRNLVYVDSIFGYYLVPFKIGPPHNS